MNATFPILRLRREQDNTIYAHMCLTCGGASKIYHTQQVCHCGAMSLPATSQHIVEGPWREVRWDGRDCDGTLTVRVYKRTRLNSLIAGGWVLTTDASGCRRMVYPTKREAVAAAKRRCARVHGKMRLFVDGGRGDKEMSLSCPPPT